MRRITVLVLASFISLVASADCEVLPFFASPNKDDAVRDAIVSLIESAGVDINVVIYSFTDATLANALILAHRRGIDVDVYMDNTQAGNPSSVDEMLAQAGLDVYINTHSYVFHHKFMIVDSGIVVTGSYNWSDNANDKNFENVVVVICPDVAYDYLVELIYLKETYGFWRVGDDSGSNSDCNCTGSDLDCGDFACQPEAQACFDKCYSQYGDVFQLDGNNDGTACESLPKICP